MSFVKLFAWKKVTRVEEEGRILCSTYLSLGVWGKGDLGSYSHINGPLRLP